MIIDMLYVIWKDVWQHEWQQALNHKNKTKSSNDICKHSKFKPVSKTLKVYKKLSFLHYMFAVYARESKLAVRTP